MKVPDDLVDAACEKLRPDIRVMRHSPLWEHQRKALEAVLPKVRERLLSEEAVEAAWAVWREPHGRGSTFAEQYKARTQAAFDHAFPEEEP